MHVFTNHIISMQYRILPDVIKLPNIIKPEIGNKNRRKLR